MSSVPHPRGFELTLPSRFLLCSAGVLGVCGITVGAAGAHAGGGNLARLASTFLLIHAVAVLALGVAAFTARRPWPFYTSGALLVVGASAFGGDLSMLAFTGVRGLRLLAPVGGVLMSLGWTALIVLPWIGGRSLRD